MLLRKIVSEVWRAVQEYVRKTGGERDMDIIMRIEEHYPSMTKKQKQIADYIKENIDTMTFITLRELSKELGVTEITILNTCKALGYNSFNEMKYEVRKYSNMNQRIDVYQKNEYFSSFVPQYELNNKEQLLREICMEEKGLMEEYVRSFDSRYLIETARLFLKYSKIILCGRGLSHILCQWLASNLAGTQIASMIVNTELNESVYSALPALDSDTLLVAISFPDYYFMTEQVARYAKRKGAFVLGISDRKSSGVAKTSDALLTARTTTRMFMNTASTPMALINMLSSAIKIEGDKDERIIGEEFGGLFH